MGMPVPTLSLQQSPRSRLVTDPVITTAAKGGGGYAFEGESASEVHHRGLVSLRPESALPVLVAHWGHDQENRESPV